MTAYADIDALNWSTLKLIATSPRLLKWRADHPRKDTPALARGRAIHCAILEHDRFASEYVAQPDLGDGRTRAGKAAKAEWLETVPDGAEVLSAAEYELVTRCAAAVADHPRAAELLQHGRPEEQITWTDEGSGIRCKARLDYIRPTGLLDLKSTRRETLREIVADLARYLVHGQLAWYHGGAKTAGVIPDDADLPYVIAVQTCEPYDVVPFQMSPLDLDAGIRLVRSLLRRYQDCQAAGWWPGMAPEVIELGLPQWAAGDVEEAQEEDW